MTERRADDRPTGPAGETTRAFGPGTNVLVQGPSLAGKRTLTLELLAALEPDERPVVVSAAADATSIRRQLVTAGSRDVSDDCYVVDAVRSQLSGQTAVRTDGGDRRTWYASSPNDLTGIGISTTRALSAVRAAGERARIAVDSLSTLLQYNSLERVYQFLHVMNSRVHAVDGTTIQVLHADAHSDREVATLAHLFDAVVDVGTGAAEGRVAVRTGSTRQSVALSDLVAPPLASADGCGEQPDLSSA